MMTLNHDDPRLRFISLDKAIIPPPGLIEHLDDRWWAVHPTKGLIFYRPRGMNFDSPQCNSNENITKDLRDRLYPWADIKFIPSVFRRIDPHDY